MEKTYNDLIELITSWKLFKEENTEGGINDFGRWLGESEKKTQHYGETKDFIVSRTRELEGENVRAASVANRAIIGSLIGRMGHFVKNYTKIPFHDLGVNSMDEFKILSLIERLKQPNKTNLSQAALMEFSTINDMLKRFKNKEWVKQEKDEQDKRATLVKLTGKGSEVLHHIYKTLSNIQPPITGDLSQEEQQELTRLLNKLNQFHTDYYKTHYLNK